MSVIKKKQILKAAINQNQIFSCDQNSTFLIIVYHSQLATFQPL